MTKQTFFEKIKGKNIDISKLHPDPGCSPPPSSEQPPGWYYLTHRYIIDNGNITCVPLDKPIISYADQDASYIYLISIFTNGLVDVDNKCCTNNPITEINCNIENQVMPCIFIARMNKSNPVQIDENIPVEIENKALQMLPFGEGISSSDTFNLNPIIVIGIAGLLLYFLIKR